MPKFNSYNRCDVSCISDLKHKRRVKMPVKSKFYFNTFECEITLDDAECDEADNSCLFDELYDELVSKIRKKIQNI